MINLQMFLSIMGPVLFGWGTGYFFALDKSMTDYVGWKGVVFHPPGAAIDVLSESEWLHFRRLSLAAEMARVSSRLRRRLNLFFALSAIGSAVLVMTYFGLHVACPTDLCKKYHGLEEFTMKVLIVLPAYLFSSYYIYNLIWLRRRTGAPAEYI